MCVRKITISLISTLTIPTAGSIVFLRESHLSLGTKILVILEEILITVFIILFRRANFLVPGFEFSLIGVGIALRLPAHPFSFLGGLSVLLGLIIVILHTKNLLSKLKERAYLDHLTRLYTHFSLRNGYLIDLDNLKEINDKFSHQIEDEALRILARAIKENIRITDAAVRYGGDEFLIALLGESKDTAKKVIRRIRNSIRKERFKTSISITAGITE